MTKKQRLGWLGPVLALVGVAVGILGIWYMAHAKPRPGDIIGTYPVGGTTKLVVRHEASGPDRAFVERYDGDALVWQALVPRYGGSATRPGIAWSQNAVTVRVLRNGRAEIFALAMNDSRKIGGFRLAPNHEGVVQDAGPVTVTDHIRSYEIVSGADWHQLVGVDLQTGKGLWRAELGAAPIADAGVTGGEVWVVQNGTRRSFNVFTGVEKIADKPPTSMDKLLR